MPIVVLDLPPGSPVDHRLVRLETGAFLPLSSCDGHRAKLDATLRSVKLNGPRVDADSVEAGAFQLEEERVLLKGPRDATGPEVGIGFEHLRNLLVADEVRDGDAATGF